jgi:hypothetical protein
VCRLHGDSNGSMDGGGDDGDGISNDGGVRRRLMSSSQSLSSSASHRLFLVLLAGGEMGGGGSAGGSSLVVGAMVVGCRQAAMVAEGHRWRRRRRLRTVAVVVGVRKRQERVTSWYPVIWFTETRAAWPVATQMSYNDMKSKIEGLLSLEPARVAAHVGAMVRATLAGWVDEVGGGSPASREPSTLWGEAGRLGVG